MGGSGAAVMPSATEGQCILGSAFAHWLALYCLMTGALGHSPCEATVRALATKAGGADS